MKADLPQAPAFQKNKESKSAKPALSHKATEMTPEQNIRLEQMYRERYAGAAQPWLEMIKEISDELWVNRRVVSSQLQALISPDVMITPERRSRIIEMYKSYMDHGDHPPEGRYKKIGLELGIPHLQVREIVSDWSQSQFKDSPTPKLTRELRFEIEKRYWKELDAQLSRLEDIPAKLAEDMGGITAFQVLGWLDTLHDENARFERVTDVSQEIEARVIDAYNQYLAAPEPPAMGLHATIAASIGGITPRQVHKVLQRYRNRRKMQYPHRTSRSTSQPAAD
jgi:hypothetical protein